jgi:hypothetical protein
MLLNQIARGQEHAPGLKRLTSRSAIEATFSSALADARLKASIDSYANESNHDVILGTRQKWHFMPRRKGRKPFASELPLPAFGPHLQTLHRYYRHASNRALIARQLQYRYLLLTPYDS